MAFVGEGFFTAEKYRPIAEKIYAELHVRTN